MENITENLAKFFPENLGKYYRKSQKNLPKISENITENLRIIYRKSRNNLPQISENITENLAIIYRGYPRCIYSDPGSNLDCASKELRAQWEIMWKEERGKITSKSAEQGLKWIFSTADSPWQNGAAEALVKSCKTVLSIVLRDQRLTPFEFSAVLYDVANTVNERPIGVTSVDSDLSILTPNSLLLGRSTAKNPGGWQPTSDIMARFHLVQQISNAFWSQWLTSVAPGLITDARSDILKQGLEAR